ncbi:MULTISPECIES: hypothetical protein [Lactobacillus]|uniref:Uncharacterized protein n=1 Tax=Lactobacillus xujianguonis TaxID=2495899 RepID=A0A437SU59_9LACO|nr:MULTISPECIES: hypothetical protein [Lactobacillus]RVU70481.1 hypothetical protein EJK17_07250 [Lactobacillus xujianguonis]RVU76849.1 hypothetical protein EJK20_03455 [Lactobacillus xujianguonis]
MIDSSKFRPGTIVKTHFSRQRYLVISTPVVVRGIQVLIKVVPIAEKIDNEVCKNGHHLLMPSNAKTKGTICLHMQDTLNCDQLEFVERLNDSLADYVVQNM